MLTLKNLGLFAMCLFAVTPYANGSYSFTTVDVPGATQTGLNGISGNTVVGSTSTATYRGFTATNGIISALPPAPSQWTVLGAYGISGNTICGSYSFAGDGSQRGYLLDSQGNYTSIQYPGSRTTTVQGISGNSIVGDYIDGIEFGYVLTNGTFTKVAYPSAQGYTNVEGIYGNTVFGSYLAVVPGRLQGFIEVDGVYSTFNVPGAIETEITCMSDQIIAGICVFTGPYYEGFVYLNGRFRFLQDPDSVGIGGGLGSTEIHGADGTTVVGLYTINNAITNHDDANGFIATFDAPEPASLALLCSGVAILLVRRRKI